MTSGRKFGGKAGSGGNDSLRDAEMNAAIVAMISVTALACLATGLALWGDAKKQKKANEEEDRQRQQWKHL